MMHKMSSSLLCLLTLSALAFPSTALAANDPEDVLLDEDVRRDLASRPETFSSPELPAAAPSVLPDLRLSNSTSLLHELQKKPQTSKTDEPLDPTDPLQFMTSFRLGLEFNDLSNGEGSNGFLRLQGNMALNPKMLLHAELPLGWSNLSHTSSDAGIGDLRFAFYYLGKRESDSRKLIQGVMPGVELILPTGSATNGLGGDAGLLIPYLNLQMNVSETVTISNVLRYVHSFSRYRPAGNPDINVPTSSKGRNSQDGKTVREIWWQIPVTVKPEDMWLTWMTFTPDMAWNFQDNMTRSYRLDIEAGKTFKEDFSVAANLTLPLNSGNAINWIFGIQAILTF